jgi:hypothetical protein
MFLAKKPLARRETSRTFRKHLEYLYARRSAIDALIESLQSYEQFRPKQAEPRRRKSA